MFIMDLGSVELFYNVCYCSFITIMIKTFEADKQLTIHFRANNLFKRFTHLWLPTG